MIYQKVLHIVRHCLWTYFMPLLLIGISQPLGAQIFEENGYILGTFVEVAIDGDAGHEGTADWPGNHSRGGTEEVPFGFVANPTMDGWINYNGDYFTAGTPENGFGLEINGTNYSNNGWNAATLTTYLQEIPQLVGTTITYSEDGLCKTIEWQGKVAGVKIIVKYNHISGTLYYTTDITLVNESGAPINDLYYYRNVDPDNNHALTGAFATTNKIEYQPDPDCIKALVSATQAAPFSSYVGLGALGEKFRVAHGGFSNRSGSDIWNATGLNGTEGDVVTADEAIALAYKTDIGAGQTVNFSYNVVLSPTAIEAAFASLYYITYQVGDEMGGELSGACNPSTVTVSACAGNEIMLVINGPNVDDYDWTWPVGPINNDTAYYSPYIPSIYTVNGIPISDCFTSPISKEIQVVFDQGPKLDFIDPGPICESFDITEFEYWETTGNENLNCVFLTVQPDSANQTEPSFEGPMIGPSDSVYVMCGDTTTNCFDFFFLDLNFVGLGYAGRDTTVTTCGGPGMVISLLGMVAPDTSNFNGYFYDFSDTDRLDDSTGIFNGSNLYGTFDFAYIVEGIDDCPDDTAFLTVELIPPPFARFKYEVLGISSDDGLSSSCILNTVDFINTSTIEPPGVITQYKWYFGDGDSSDVENPSHTYEAPGVYTIVLYVFSDNGCRSEYAKSIYIYEAPYLDFVYSEPLCNGYETGVIIVTTDVDISLFQIEITDEEGNILNEDGGVEIDSLPAGTYYISAIDESGCGADTSVTLFEPPPLDIFYHYVNPPCLGDSGWVVIDSVSNESLNNPIYYVWEPNPAGIEGYGADSSYWMTAGDYKLTATDSKGCNNFIEVTLVDPPLFYFTDWGWDTAYCRLYDYQSGNGVVYAGAAGGLTNYTYEWTYLVDSTTSNNSTWGGRNPGDHLITITDGGGCVLKKIIHVDSVNPIASFDVVSQQLNEALEGTADVEALFINTSRYYANPNNPLADTTFFWDLDRTDTEDWMITHDFYETYDTIYKQRGESYEIDVCLIAFNKNGCTDTACKVISIFEPPVLTPINIFTPNGSGSNDYFTFKEYAKGINKFRCTIVDRWGVTVGEVNDINDGWDGIDQRGVPCPDGVYFYTYTAEGDNGDILSGQGHLTIANGRW
jgi:gliding motility-associated-like protein